MTGGGFGGSCIAIVRAGDAEAVADAIAAAFEAAWLHGPGVVHRDRVRRGRPRPLTPRAH